MVAPEGCQCPRAAGAWPVRRRGGPLKPSVKDYDSAVTGRAEKNPARWLQVSRRHYRRADGGRREWEFTMVELTEESDDEDLVLGMMLQDEEALRLVLSRHGPQIKGWLIERYRFVLHPEEIDDAFSRATLKLWKYADRYKKTKGSLGAWFQAIAKRTVQDVFKGKKRYRRRHGQVEEDFDLEEDRSLSDDSPLPPDVHQRYKALYQIIETKLKGNQREILKADIAAGGDGADDEWLAERWGQPRRAFESLGSKQLRTFKSTSKNWNRSKSEIEARDERGQLVGRRRSEDSTCKRAWSVDSGRSRSGA